MHCQCGRGNHEIREKHENDARRFSRAAQSCSLLRTGTYPCSVSERLRIASDASVVTANYARSTTAPQGAAHQLRVRSQGSLLVASISDGFATGAYAQRALRAGLPGRVIANYARRTTAPRRDGLRPRGCRLVLLRSENDARRVLNARTLGLFPSRNSAQGV